MFVLSRFHSVYPSQNFRKSLENQGHQHGLKTKAWLMQHQYEHGGFEFQDKGQTTLAWKTMTKVSLGDWLLAYLAESTFYAIGRVCVPRKFSEHSLHTDSVAKTVSQWRHVYFDGIVQYTDAPAFYEDFTDSWSIGFDPPRQGQPPTWPYAQRIDVAKWEHVAPEGIEVHGLMDAAKEFHRKPVFEIDADFFHDVADELRVASENATSE